MKIYRLLTAALLCLTLVACSQQQTAPRATPDMRVPIIFDTDMAIDDWGALLFLAQHPKAKLLAVTTNGAGETRCDPALRNIPALLALSDANPVPFACG
ncbi:MAG: nucleoside hydrolase, partial [Pseudomonadales bacterium]